MDNTIVWADIPVTDLDRAMKFYSAVLQHEFVKVPGMEGIALLAPEPGMDNLEGPAPVSIDLAVVQDYKPSRDGCTIYLNSHDDPEGMLQRAAEAGGQILARWIQQRGWRLLAVLNNDMIGNSQGIDGITDNATARVFSDAVPPTETEPERARRPPCPR